MTLDGEVLYPAADHNDRWRATRIGVIPQLLYLLPSLSALDNVRLAQYFVGNAESGTASVLLKDLGLQARLNARPEKLSVGEQQRVAIARAIVNKPRCCWRTNPRPAWTIQFRASGRAVVRSGPYDRCIARRRDARRANSRTLRTPSAFGQSAGMNAGRLIIAQLLRKPLQTVLAVLLLALATLVFVVLVQGQLSRQLTRDAQGIDLVVAKGSPCS